MKGIQKLIGGICLAMATCALSFQANGGQPLRVWEFPYHISSRGQAETLKPGAEIAMSCTKCKAVQVCDVDNNSAFLTWFTPKTKHPCPGCGGYWAPHVSYGVERYHSKWVHTCSKCGDKSMFCCSTEPGKKTLGM